MIIDKVITKIKKSEKILLLTHEKPDGDALGSMLGLNIGLRKIKKDVECFCSDRVPQIFFFLPRAKTIKKDFLLGDFDLIIILDCGDARRTGFPKRLKNLTGYKNKIINIDHHPKNDLHKLAKINLIDYNSSSTSEIIYTILKRLKIKIDKDIALCLLCGLYTDTGSFMHSNTSPETLKIASDLLRCGARFRKITENVVNSHTLPALKLRGIALSRLKINKKYKIATSIIDQNDMKKCNATNDDVAGIVNMINVIPGIKVSLFIYEQDKDIIKGSLRTEENKINLTRLARLFGGGGLKKASGFTMDGRLIVKGNKWEIIYK